MLLVLEGSAAQTGHVPSDKHVSDHGVDRSPDTAAVSVASSREAPATPAGTIYTCPMHPEVRQDHPGNCPICGMSLEPVIPLDDEENHELADLQRRFWWTLPLTVIVTVPTSALAGVPLKVRVTASKFSQPGNALVL